MTGKNYPKEIYRADDIDGGIVVIASVRKQLEKAYDLGYQHGQLEVRRDGLDPVDTWTRLTTSNPDWDRIDWDALYERPVLLRHVPSFSTICTKIVSKGPYTVGYDDGPRKIPADQALLLKALPKMTHSSLHGATQAALEDRDGWALYVLGELPLRKRTADQLDPGTCFMGRYRNQRIKYAQVIAYDNGNRLVTNCNTAGLHGFPVSDVEVIEVYGVGTFEKPKGDA